MYIFIFIISALALPDAYSEDPKPPTTDSNSSKQTETQVSVMGGATPPNKGESPGGHKDTEALTGTRVSYTLDPGKKTEVKALELDFVGGQSVLRVAGSTELFPVEIGIFSNEELTVRFIPVSADLEYLLTDLTTASHVLFSPAFEAALSLDAAKMSRIKLQMSPLFGFAEENGAKAPVSAFKFGISMRAPIIRTGTSSQIEVATSLAVTMTKIRWDGFSGPPPSWDVAGSVRWVMQPKPGDPAFFIGPEVETCSQSYIKDVDASDQTRDSKMAPLLPGVRAGVTW